METQSGARTPLVDPFGRELEEWLRDAPATRSPYLADLVVPPVTGPVRRPVLPTTDASADDAVVDVTAPEPVEAATEAVDDATAVEHETASAADTAPTSGDDRAFRRPRARHAVVCAPSFPEPPERLALRFDDLVVAIDPSSGRSTAERIDLLADEVRVRDEDLARLAAWEAVVADRTDAEVEGARAFAREVFADLLADAAREAARRERAALRRAATAPVTVGVVQPYLPAPHRAVAEPVALDLAALAADDAALPTARPDTAQTTAPATSAAPTTAGPDLPARPVSSLQGVRPVSASTRPTPLVQPATGPTVIDREAFAAVLRAHTGEHPVVSVSVPVVAPVAAPASPVAPADEDTAREAHEDTAEPVTPGWWSRLVTRLLQLVGRR